MADAHESARIATANFFFFFFPSVFSPIIPVTEVDVIPPQRLLSSELKDYSPETCAVDGCDLPVYKPGNNPP